MKPLALTVFLAFLAPVALAAPEDLNLPEVLKTLDGKRVTSPEAWRESRRPEVLELVREFVYGRAPVGRPSSLRFEIRDTLEDFMSGDATRKLIDIHFAGAGGRGTIHLTVFIPNKVKKPVPGFVLICNRGRENIDPERKTISGFWPAEQMVRRGDVAATFHNSDLNPDEHDGFNNCVHGYFDPWDT